MFPRRCDVCGRPAKFHETRLDGDERLERHLCAVHGRKAQLVVVKDVLAAEIKSMPGQWLVDPDEARQRIAGASSLGEIAREFCLDDIARNVRGSQ
jgi:hypothetical protein